MIYIRIANPSQTELISQLSKTTYVESHGHFIPNKNDLQQYIDRAFSIFKTKQDFDHPNNLFYIVYSDDVPVGYAKLVLNAECEGIVFQKICQLERIYILSDYLTLKVGQPLLTFLEEKARALDFDTMWLTVYIKNHRAIRFYERNEFKASGVLTFLVNGTGYETTVFEKKL